MVNRKPRVTISVPAWKAQNTIRRCVDSILAQTVSDFRLVVTNDGGDPSDLAALDELDDPRLKVVHGKRNRGRYAIDHDLARSCRTEWFAVVDADDWVEPDWLESLLKHAESDDDVVMGPHIVHGLRRTSEDRVEVEEFDGRFRWHAHMGACLWRVSWLMRVGATTDAVRIGWDSVMTGLPFLVGNRVEISRATYHRVRREGSLTTTERTGSRSPMRTHISGVLADIWNACVLQPTRTREITSTLASRLTAREIIPGLPFTTWAMSHAALVELDALLWRDQPRTVVECGTGLSSVVLGNYARATGATVVSLDHDPRFAKQTRDLLARYRLSEVSEVQRAHLVGSPPFYRVHLPSGIDFALIDGPPEKDGGREATLPSMLGKMSPGWLAWLDDSHREIEQRALAAWQADHRVKVTDTLIPRSVSIVTPRKVAAPKMRADDVTIAVLTGHRPHHLWATLASLPQSLLDSARLVIFHDGDDEATREVIDEWQPYIDELHTYSHPTQRMHTIGENFARIAATCADLSPFMLVLEDDWEHITLDYRWLDNARAALDDPTVAQVRLRHASDATLGRNMVTREPVRWMPHEFGAVAETHLTNNPALMRSTDLARVWPAEGEKEMQRNAWRLGLRRVVSLYPGVFRHTGASDSMRLTLGSPP